jgi:hypothetical protein
MKLNPKGQRRIERATASKPPEILMMVKTAETGLPPELLSEDQVIKEDLRF